MHVAHLEHRLGEAIGVSEQRRLQASLEVDAADPKRIAELHSEVQRLRRLSTEKDDELSAVRRINADLTRRHNQF